MFLDSTIDKNYKKEDRPLISLETYSDSSSTISGRTMKRRRTRNISSSSTRSSTTSGSTRTSSTCSTCGSSDSATDGENEEKMRTTSRSKGRVVHVVLVIHRTRILLPTKRMKRKCVSILNRPLLKDLDIICTCS